MLTHSDTFIRTHEPPFPAVKATQDLSIAWLIDVLERSRARASDSASAADIERAKTLYRVMIAKTAIAERGSWLTDFVHRRWDEMLIFGDEPSHGGRSSDTLERRMTFFRDTVKQVVTDAFSKEASPPDHLIQVSCTGYYSPHAIQTLCLEKGWLDKSKVLSVGHMGCYAAIPTVGMAAQLVSAKRGARSETVFAELCTLHLKPESIAPDQIVINSIFSDGIIRVTATDQPTSDGWRWIDHRECLIPGTADLMTWFPSDRGFAMTLSGSVPARIQESLLPLVLSFLRHHDLKLEEIDFFGIHPGGRRIIESVGGVLEALPEQIAASQAVFRMRGNMSSATLPHIWHHMSCDASVKPGARVLSMAFGPGLTVAMSLMEKC